MSILLALALGVSLLDPQPLETLRLKVFDLLQQTQTASAANADMAIVDIDEQSLSRLGQ